MMQIELATWRPLWDSAAVLFVLGVAGGISGRDRASCWVSQGLLLLSIVVGVAAASATHADVDLFSLGIWVVVAWGLMACISLRRRVPHPSPTLADSSRGES